MTEPTPPQKRPRKLWRGLLWAGGALVVLLLVLRFLLLGPLALDIASWAAERYGDYRLEAGSLHTNGHSFVEVTDLSLKALAEDLPLRSLTASRLRVDFSLGAALRLQLGAVQLLQAQNLVIDADLTRGEEPAEDAPPFRLPARLPAARIDSVQAYLKLTPDQQLEIEGESLVVDPGLTAETLRLLVPSWKLLGSDGASYGTDLELEARYAGGVLDLEPLRVEKITAGPGSRLDLSRVGEGAIEAHLLLSSPYGGGEITAGLEGAAVDAQLDLKDLDLAAIRHRLGLETSLAGRGHLTAKTKLSLDDPLAGSGEATLSFRDTQLAQTHWQNVESRLKWADGLLAIPALHLEQAENRVEAELAGLPLANLDPEAWLRSATGRLSADLPDVPRMLATGGVDLTGAVPGRIPEHRLRLAGDLFGGTLELSEGSLEVRGSGRLILEKARIEHLEGLPEEPSAIALILAADANFADLAPLGRIFDSRPWGGRLEGRVEVSGRYPDLVGEARLTGREVLASGLRLGEVEVAAIGRDRRLELEELRVQDTWGRLRAEGAVVLDRRRFEGITFRLEAEDLAALGVLASATTGDSSDGEVAGAAQPQPLAGEVFADGKLSGPWEQPDVQLSAHGSLRWDPRFPIEDFQLEAGTEDGRLAVERLRWMSPFGEISAAAEADGVLPADIHEIRLTAFEIDQGGQDLILQEPVTVRLAKPLPVFEGLLLNGSAGTLGASVEGEGEAAVITLRSEALDPMPFIGPFLPPETWLTGIDLQVSGRWQEGQLAFEGRGDVARIQLQSLGNTLGVSWEGRLRPGLLDIDSLQIRLEDQPLLEATGQLPMDPLGGELLAAGPVSLEGRLLPAELERLPVVLGEQGAYLSGAFEGTFRAGGSWQALTAGADVSGEQILLEIAGVGGPNKRVGPGTLSARLELGPAGLVLSKLSADLGDDLKLQATGSLGIPSDLTAYLDSGNETGDELTRAPLQLSAQVEAPRIDWARPWLPGVRRLDGNARLNVEAGGTLGQPQMGGRLELHGGTLRLQDGGISVDAVEARLVLESDIARIETLTGELGSAPFEGTGEIRLGEGGPELDLQLKGENLLLARDADFRLRSDIDVTITGPLEAAQIRGRLGIRNAQVRQEIDLLGLLAGEINSTLTGGAPAGNVGGLQLFSLPDPPLSNATFDLQVVTVEPVKIASNLAEGGVRLDLRLRGTGQVPLPEGQIFLDSTQLRLPSGGVELDSGTLTFTRRSPFNPDLAVRGNARLKGYDVSLQILGTLEAPEILLSSSPPLPNEDLLLLVLTGQVPTSSGGTLAQQQAAETVALFLARDFLVRWFGKGDRDDASWVDRFEIVRGRDVSENGVETTDATFLIDDDVFGTEGDVYLVGEQDAFEDYNYGIRLVFRFQ